MAISHRLHSPMDVRPDEGTNEKPKRIVFLSVEGNDTEKDYFSHLHKYREELGIQSIVHVETLTRWNSDTQSTPEQVLELLIDYTQIRDEGILAEDLLSVANADGDLLSLDYIEKYLQNELPARESKKIREIIRLAGIDLDYQKFLSGFRGEQGNDIFAVVIDRDQYSHTEDSMLTVMEKCIHKGYLCFISNPCFEFWLLLHLSDVINEYREQLDSFLSNHKISNQHTVVSFEVSKKAHHKKVISESSFVKFYLHNVDAAIERASNFAQDKHDLLSQLGSNIPQLLKILRERV